MNLTRREVFAGIAGAGGWTLSHGPRVILDAVSGPRLPHTLVIPALPASRSGFIELREYRAAKALPLDHLHEQLREIFAKSGMRPVLWERGEALRYFFQFESLAARATAWTDFASHPAWCALREAGDPLRLAEVSIYRVRFGRGAA